MIKKFLFTILFAPILANANPLNDFSCKTTNDLNLKINNSTLFVKKACTDAEKEVGLMFVKNLPVNNGMLFIFNKPQTVYFWMKNTLIDLDVVYMNKNRKITAIHHLKSLDLTPIQSPNDTLYVLEANKDWFKSNNIKVGTIIN